MSACFSLIENNVDFNFAQKCQSRKQRDHFKRAKIATHFTTEMEVHRFNDKNSLSSFPPSRALATLEIALRQLSMSAREES